MGNFKRKRDRNVLRKAVGNKNLGAAYQDFRKLKEDQRRKDAEEEKAEELEKTILNGEELSKALK